MRQQNSLEAPTSRKIRKDGVLEGPDWGADILPQKEFVSWSTLEIATPHQPQHSHFRRNTCGNETLSDGSIQHWGRNTKKKKNVLLAHHILKVSKANSSLNHPKTGRLPPWWIMKKITFTRGFSAVCCRLLLLLLFMTVNVRPLTEKSYMALLVASCFLEVCVFIFYFVVSSFWNARLSMAVFHSCLSSAPSQLRPPLSWAQLLFPEPYCFGFAATFSLQD